MITMKNENIITVTSGFIVHGCNAHGVMGSGVAFYLKNKYPVIFQEYHQLCKSESDKSKLLGKYTVNRIGRVTIYNLITQMNYGYDGKAYASLEAIESGLDQIAEIAALEQEKLSIPVIGCGRGGLDWETQVKPIVENICKKYEINIDIYYIKE